MGKHSYHSLHIGHNSDACIENTNGPPHVPSDDRDCVRGDPVPAPASVTTPAPVPRSDARPEVDAVGVDARGTAPRARLGGDGV